jgi:putative nucleotidyltransferase with HDIG domain
METLAESVDTLVGRVIAGHRLITELGSGGMGKVYYAEHQVIGRRAAIKVLNPEVARDQTATSRFLTEARVVNEIQHPNVVEITDIGHDGGLHYIIMPLLEGETLGERLDRVRTLDEPATLRMARQVSAALDAAHKRGIVHRDLKPENIFLTSHPDFPDYVKVLDFGVAKLQGLPSGSPALTMAGTVVGTPFYMSPEQCRGSEQVDGRSDIYALAVVLYQALTGNPPFTSEDIMEVLIAHTSKAPTPAITINPAISPHVNTAIMRGLEKDPAARFATMLEFRDALENPPRPEPAPAAAPAGDGQSAPDKAAEKEKPKEEEDPRAKGVRGVADKLSQIIDARLQTDRLVVPTMPLIAIQCLEAIRNPKLSFKTVGATIGKDPILSSRVLKAANSAAFPGLTPVTTLEGAIARMGIEGLSAILVQYSVYQAFTSRDERIRQSFKGIWEHSLGVALVARELAQRLTPNGPDANAAYLAGLLHDVGKPVVASLLLEAEKAITQGNKGAWLDEEIWRKIVNESHRKVGVLLAKRWNLPADVVVTIENCTAYDRNIPRACGNVVRLANALCKRAGLYVGSVAADELEQTIESGQVIMGLQPGVSAAVSKDIYTRVATMYEAAPRLPRVRTRS